MDVLDNVYGQPGSPLPPKVSLAARLGRMAAGKMVQGVVVSGVVAAVFQMGYLRVFTVAVCKVVIFFLGNPDPPPPLKEKLDKAAAEVKAAVTKAKDRVEGVKPADGERDAGQGDGQGDKPSTEKPTLTERFNVVKEKAASLGDKVEKKVEEKVVAPVKETAEVVKDKVEETAATLQRNMNPLRAAQAFRNAPDDERMRRDIGPKDERIDYLNEHGEIPGMPPQQLAKGTGSLETNLRNRQVQMTQQQQLAEIRARQAQRSGISGYLQTRQEQMVLQGQIAERERIIASAAKHGIPWKDRPFEEVRDEVVAAEAKEAPNAYCTQCGAPHRVTTKDGYLRCSRCKRKYSVREGRELAKRGGPPMLFRMGGFR